MSIQSITAAPWYPLSATYAYDNWLSFEPTLIPYNDGYNVFYHPIFENMKDVTFQNKSTLWLTHTQPLSTSIQQIAYTDAYVGSYIVFHMNNGLLTTIPGTSSLVVSAVDFTKYSFFRMVYNNNGSVSFLNGDELYITTNEVEPFDLYLYPPLSEKDNITRQQFYVIALQDKYGIQTKVQNPLYILGIGPEYNQRFWSFSQITSSLRAIGAIADDDYNFVNNYQWSLSGYNIMLPMQGLVCEHIWVKYHNDVIDTRQSKTPEIKYSIDGVKINKLVDLPYCTQIDISANKMSINLANLKTIETSKYELDVNGELL